MGVYSYGSDITEPENRAQRFAGFDGTEICGLIIGTLASAPIYTHGGFYARYNKNRLCSKGLRRDLTKFFLA